MGAQLLNEGAEGLEAVAKMTISSRKKQKEKMEVREFIPDALFSAMFDVRRGQ